MTNLYGKLIKWAYSPAKITHTKADAIRFRRETAELDHATVRLLRAHQIYDHRSQPNTSTSYAVLLHAEALAAARNRQNLRDLFIFVHGDAPGEAERFALLPSDDRVECLLQHWSKAIFTGRDERFYHAPGQRIPYRGVNGEVEWRN